MTEERFLVEASKPASPIVIPTGDVDQMFPGLSKKEYFAALMMQALVASPDLVDRDENPNHHRNLAQFAVAYAEALLWELGGVQ